MTIDPRLSTALADRYRIERELGAGGMATVYLAQDLKHDRQVAIKVLRPELAAALGAERFLREIETTAKLSHPHILPLLRLGRGRRRSSTTSCRYVEGESLRDRLDREKQLPRRRRARGSRARWPTRSSYAHAHGVVHRDIKPENILLDERRTRWWPTSGSRGGQRSRRRAGSPRPGSSVGTPQYMSPEQAAGDRDLDGRSDLYSLGCVLYEMLAGQPPFTGPTAASVVHQHMTAEARPISQLRPAVPAAIADVLARALAKNPADRFSPAAQFAAALTGPRRSRRQAASGGPSRACRPHARGRDPGSPRGSRAREPPAGGAPAVTVGRTIQVTRDPGLEVDPALSPDGATLAYASGPTNAMQIYVRQVSGGRTVALTSDTTNNFRWPRWSPDGSQIAYQSNDGIHVVPALGGAPRRVTRLDSDTLRQQRLGYPDHGIDWSPDGSRIGWTFGYNGEEVTVMTVSSGAIRKLPGPKRASPRRGHPMAAASQSRPAMPRSFSGLETSPTRPHPEIWVVHLDGTRADQDCHRQVAQPRPPMVSRWPRAALDLGS